MRVLIISFFNGWRPHFGTELELAQRHLDEGDDVEMIGCDGVIGCCDVNISGERSICSLCVDTRIAGLGLLSKRVRMHNLRDYLDSKEAKLADSTALGIADTKSAKDLTDPGKDLGWGALSSTISSLRDPHCETDQAKQRLRKFISSALRSYFATRNFLNNKRDYQRVYIFNGRFASTRGALRACQDSGAKGIYLHERGANKDKFALFENVFPHDRKYLQTKAEQMWNEQHDENVKHAAAKEFYCNRRYGKPSGWKSFTEHQVIGQLPENWDSGRRNIAIFNSSEDEFASIGKEWEHPIYPTQALGIARIVEDYCKSDPRAYFYLRVHPNLMRVKNKDLDTLLGLKHPHLSIILPDAPVCSYALMDNVDSVLTFGSTMGIEAVYWGRPSILCSHAFYEDLDGTYNATSHEDVLGFLSKDLSPKPKLGALKYGYYLQSFGTEFKYYKASSLLAGQFNHVELIPEYASPILRFLSRHTYQYPVLHNAIRIFGRTARYLKGFRNNSMKNR